MLKQSEVIATKVQHNNGLILSAIVNGYREATTYYGYPKREAIRLFVAEMNARKAN